jgi:hypothetical protein
MLNITLGSAAIIGGFPQANRKGKSIEFTVNSLSPTLTLRLARSIIGEALLTKRWAADSSHDSSLPFGWRQNRFDAGAQARLRSALFHSTIVQCPPLALRASKSLD